MDRISEIARIIDGEAFIDSEVEFQQIKSFIPKEIFNETAARALVEDNQKDREERRQDAIRKANDIAALFVSV